MRQQPARDHLLAAAVGAATFLLQFLPARLAELSPERKHAYPMGLTSGLPAYTVGLPLLALTAGFVWQRPWSASLALAANASVVFVASFSTPRGDNDGLWGLIFPVIGFFAVVTGVAHSVGRLLGKQLFHRSSGDDEDGE